MLTALRRLKNVFAILALGLAVSVTAVDMAEARRAGGGLGSRGTRTFQAPPATRTAPQPAAPIDRSMTPRTNQANQPGAAAAPQAAARPGGLFGGFGRTLMGGLLMGGLLGMLFGGGFGGAMGFLGMLLQVAIIGGLIMLALRFFANRNRPAYSAPGNSGQSAYARTPPQSSGPSFEIPKIGSLAGAAGGAQAVRPENPASEGDEIGITGSDQETFQSMLEEVQTAYANEDYAALRRLTTPEAMSYLAEELSENATNGRKNDVRDVHLLQGDVAEAWRENNMEYATVAMRYESIDVMRDRTTGKVVEGDENTPTETVELWTFVRRPGTAWQVSAIQSAA